MNSQPDKRNWTTIGVIALVGLLFVAALFTGNGAPNRRFDPQSNAPDGLLLLRLWLEEMGYNARMQPQMGFDLPEKAQSLLLIYPGSRDFSENEAERLYKWIEAGNSAAFFLQYPMDSALRDRFGVDLSTSNGFGTAKIAQPLIADRENLEITQSYGGNALDLKKDETAVVVLATEENAALVAVEQIGAGTVWLFNEDISFVNAQLSDQDFAAHLIPLLRTTQVGGIIQLDTFHLFGSLLGDDQEITSIQGWLYYTAWGNATLFAALILGLYLVLQGRRLGPALPTQESLRRREAAEYVVAMANLYRRGNVASDVATYQKQRLKQKLGRPLHLGSDMADATFVQTLRTHDPQIDGARAEKITKLLNSLDQADENSLIQSAADVDQFLKEVGR